MSQDNDNRLGDVIGKAHEMTEEQKAQLTMMEVQKHCVRLFDLIPPGMTVEVIVPNSKVIVPGRPAQGGKLFITKPAVLVCFERRDQ